MDATDEPTPELSDHDDASAGPPILLETVVAGWTLLQDISVPGSVRRRYMAKNKDGMQGVVTLYNAEGAEPDPEVYDELRRLSLDHIPEIFDVGRYQGRAYDVTEYIPEGNLDELQVTPADTATLRTIAFEIAKALRDFNRVGLRHRDLRPHAVLTRTRDPLDLVIDGFGSAQLSEHDLETVSPLEQTRYMAPEAVAGAVSPASDWWSLGIMLLELSTGGNCFNGVSDQAFLIHTMSRGVTIPSVVDQDIVTLLQGLLIRDHAHRWQWSEFARWYEGDAPKPPVDTESVEAESGPALEIGGRACRRPSAYALSAARAGNWDEAVDQLVRGEILTWLEDTNAPKKVWAGVKALETKDLEEDARLAIALKYLNPNMPLVYRGEIVSPGWLLQEKNVKAGYALISGDAPDLLSAIGAEKWLGRLHARAKAVHDRAKHHEIELDEAMLEVLLLSTNRARLTAQWSEKRRLLPDADHPGLAAVMDRRQLTEEDLILLLAASAGQFLTTDALIEEASTLSTNAGVSTFNTATCIELLQGHDRLELMRLIDERSADFARCGNATVDDWVDQFRIQRRMSLPRALVALSVPTEAWQIPRSQAYVQQIIAFFEQKMTFSIKRGPLARMTLSRSSARVDLTEFDTSRTPAKALLEHVIRRSDRAQELDAHAFIITPELEGRLLRLNNHTLVYRRDTGIDGLYLGFPFVLYSPSGSSMLPRIAPILMWPVKLSVSIGRRDGYSIAFDSEREEIRLNPALEGFLRDRVFEAWKKRRDAVLAGAVDMGSIVAEFAQDFDMHTETLSKLPGGDVRIPRGTGKIACSAVLFHATYIGQAIIEDLKALKRLPPDGTALAALLRLPNQGAKNSEDVKDAEVEDIPEIKRFFTIDSDPSQEAAVFAARRGPGLVIEGPPGTGKSQTIVNLIGDVIGRKKAVAVVCQKHAALEVVRKRLASEGLADRFVMVTDVNKDRRGILNDIRNQLEALRRTAVQSRLRSDRQETAQRIETIEASLAAHHKALHARDDETGVTYRELIGDLIQLEEIGPVIVNRELQRLVKDYTRQRIAAVEEEIAPLANDWLASRVEDSPLHVLRQFDWDDATIEDFTSNFAAFTGAETARLAHIRDRTATFETADPKLLHVWCQAHAGRFRNLRDDTRSRLKSWSLLFFRNGSRQNVGSELLEKLKKILDDLTNENTNAHHDEFHVLLCDMSTTSVREWIATADRASRPVGFFGRLNLSRWNARSRVRSLIGGKDETIGDTRMREFLDAAKLEARIRDHRASMTEIARMDMPALEGRVVRADVRTLRRAASDLVDWLVEVKESMAILTECVEPTQAIDSVTQAATWSQFIQTCDIVFKRHQLEVDSQDKLDQLGQWLTNEWIEERRQTIEEREDSGFALMEIERHLDRVVPFQRFRARASAMSGEARQVLAAFRASEDALMKLPKDALGNEMRRILWIAARRAWKSRIEMDNPVLLMDQNDIKAKARLLAENDRAMRRLNRSLLVDYIDRDRVGSPTAWTAITRLQGARAIRLREFMSRGADIGLMQLRPVWLMNPDVASRLLPLKSGMFDVVIYDEASQIPVEFALPTLFRGKTVVISGDEKQLPPTSFFSSKIESDEAEIFDGELPDEDLSEEEREEYEETWNRREIKDCPDLLALGRSSVPNNVLKIHYRSLYRELIEFSNSAFYRGDLNVPSRHPDDEIAKIRPIEVQYVGGVYVNQTNPEEADAIGEILWSYWSVDRGAPPSIGVVTFNRKQADLIEERLAERAAGDDAFRAALVRERNRVEGGEDMGFFVKNVENVQGDERDIVVFSTTFGLNDAGTFRRNFGVLGQRGGERRLNVAVTRARRKVVIATSMPIAEISDMLDRRDRPSKPRDFLQLYLHYATLVASGQLQEARDLLTKLNASGRGEIRTVDRVDDGFMVAVEAFIRALGHEPDRANDGTAFGVDFAIRHPVHGQYGIGIECDAPRHELLQTARARELWRPRVLERAIPVIHRVSSHGWYHSREGEKRRLAGSIENALRPAAE